METITVPAKALQTRSHYARHVAEQGHVPGVLSGAELRGKAKQYGASYARMRRRVEGLLSLRGIHSALVLDAHSKRYVRVWVDGSGAPVRLSID
jgi:hypothetical protein